MYHSLLTNATFYNSLLDFDRIIAEQTKQNGCLICHGKLHQSHFQRKPRGLPKGVDSNYNIRLSYCCGQEGCRKRFTPPSLRFLSRKVYSSTIIVLIFVLKSGTDESRVDELNNLLGTELSVETVRRWRSFWKNLVPQSNTWKRSAFSHCMAQMLPVSLLDKFQGTLRQQLKKLLKWLLPLTAGINLFDAPMETSVC